MRRKSNFPKLDVPRETNLLDISNNCSGVGILPAVLPYFLEKSIEENTDCALISLTSLLQLLA
ncbi:MAG TPA: hypothetical protein VER14_06685 [Phototrophicaceae bacterium]|nr:hypothetical protein [Phototrophicaceae bacterium]